MDGAPLPRGSLATRGKASTPTKSPCLFSRHAWERTARATVLLSGLSTLRLIVMTGRARSPNLAVPPQLVMVHVSPNPCDDTPPPLHAINPRVFR